MSTRRKPLPAWVRLALGLIPGAVVFGVPLLWLDGYVLGPFYLWGLACYAIGRASGRVQREGGDGIDEA